VPAHETLLRTFAQDPGALGLNRIAQSRPFQLSARVTEGWIIFVALRPTATQSAEAVQETADKMFTAQDVLFGLETIDHALPFQLSTRVERVPWLNMSEPPSPTATQLVALVHVTAEKEMFSELGGFGLETIDHVLPFQYSVSVKVP
jgi:hypothetical protein